MCGVALNKKALFLCLEKAHEYSPALLRSSAFLRLLPQVLRSFGSRCQRFLAVRRIGGFRCGYLFYDIIFRRDCQYIMLDNCGILWYNKRKAFIIHLRQRRTKTIYWILYASCLHLFRHIAQFVLARHVSPCWGRWHAVPEGLTERPALPRPRCTI